MKCGERLKQLRNESSIGGEVVTQERLAELSGASECSIAFIESGRTPNPGVCTLKTIVEGLGLTMGDFFNETNGST